jgi:hypothetical protein
MLPVIAGVVIGMFVNTYTEERKNRNLLENTLQALSNEFTENSEEINNKLSRHIRIIDSLTFYMDNKTYSAYEILLKAGGLSTAKISTTNWRAALNNYSLQLVDFSTIRLLSRIESLHDEQKGLDEWFTNSVYSTTIYKRGEEGVAYRRTLLGVMANYKENEQELQKLYSDFSSVVNTTAHRNR